MAAETTHEVASMRVTVVGQHAPHVPLLQRLLGNGFDVTGVASLPSAGSIETDVLVTTRLTAQEASRLRCRLLQAPGAGLDSIAVNALAGDCHVANVYEHEIPIAEFVTHAVLDHAIYPEPLRPRMDVEHWSRTYLGRCLHEEATGRRAAIVGFGAIGRATAVRLRALGLHVTAVTRRSQPEPGADAVHAVSNLAALLPRIDVLVLCCPLNDSTRGLIGAHELAAMHSSALLINVGRADLVQEEPLYQTLLAGRIGRAVLDVWYRYPSPAEAGEPLAPASFPFESLPNVRCTPHISGWTNGLLVRRYAFMAKNIGRLRSGEPLQNLQR